MTPCGPLLKPCGSVEGTKGGKFTEVYCIDISFLQLPSHILLFKGFTKQRKAWAAPSCLATQQKPHTVQFAGRLWEGGMAAISPEATEDSYEMQVRRMVR